MADQPRRKSVFRFSIGMLLFLMLCVGGYLSGYRTGYEAGEVAYQNSIMIRRVYPVGDLLRNTQLPTVGTEFDDLIDSIVATVAPGTWMENGDGEGEIQPFPSNLSLVVSQSAENHKAIAALLERRRNQSRSATEVQLQAADGNASANSAQPATDR